MLAAFGRVLTQKLQGKPFAEVAAPALERGEGLVEGTRLVTSSGWCPVEELIEGDMVLTFDRGMQRIIELHRQTLLVSEGTCASHLQPLHVPAGAIGNTGDAWILQDQCILVESDGAEALFDDPFSLLPGKALNGLRGIARKVPAGDMQIISLRFKRDEIVVADLGAQFYCPKEAEPLSDGGGDPYYRMLGRDEAELIVGFLELEGNQRGMVDLEAEIGAVA